MSNDEMLASFEADNFLADLEVEMSRQVLPWYRTSGTFSFHPADPDDEHLAKRQKLSSSSAAFDVFMMKLEDESCSSSGSSVQEEKVEAEYMDVCETYPQKQQHVELYVTQKPLHPETTYDILVHGLFQIRENIWVNRVLRPTATDIMERLEGRDSASCDTVIDTCV